tara:strand:+ start:431 stop:1390 length:960 start_codon:yes stop_codon:yes gene_type:complete
VLRKYKRQIIMNNKNALKVEKLTKIYSRKNSNEIKALNNLNLEVKEGEIFGLLGPNGAGKTTFLNILAGTVIKNSGSVNVWGYDLDKNPRQVRSSIGIVPQEVNLDAFFSPKDLLELQAGLYGIPKKDRITDIILKLVSLEKQANSYARSLSGGMKRRLLIAKAMVHRPPILVLDEPTAGVDVELRQNLWNNVKMLNKEGVTIILTTHVMYEAQDMCHRIAILNKGNLVTLDTTSNLLDRIKTKKITFKVKETITINEKDLNGMKISYRSNNEIIVLYERKKHKIDEIINKIKNTGMEIYDISTDEGDLEDVFIDVTKS